MNYNKIIYYFSILLLLLSACNNGTLPIYFENKSTNDIEIEIFVPSDVGMKYNVNSLGLLQVNYSPTNQRIVENYEEKVKNITVEFIYDAIQSNYDGFFSEADSKTDMAIMELLEPINPNDAHDWERFRRITDSLNLDALFFINNINIEFDITTGIPQDGSTYGYHTGALSCTSTFYYTVLYPDKKEFETIVSSYSDNFKNETHSYGSLAAYNNSSKKIKEVLPYLCFENGKKATAKLFPVWLNVKRKFYGKATKELREARKYIEKGNWEEAIIIWNEYQNSKNKVLAKHCQFNLILAEEVTGSLEKAAQLSERYYFKYNESLALEYRKVLEKRLIQRAKLNIQMSN